MKTNTIPEAALDAHLALLGMTGAGKSYTGRLIYPAAGSVRASEILFPSEAAA